MLSPLLRRQINRARRRLFVRRLIESCNWCWAAALLLSAGWFLAQPYLVATPPDWLRWAVAGGLFGFATLLGVLVAVLRYPTALQVALDMDEEYDLKERVTTSLMLDESTASTPAGQALADDVNRRVEKIDLGRGFPVFARQSAWVLLGKFAVVPAAAVALGLAAWLCPAAFAHPSAGGGDDLKPEEAAAVKKNVQDIIKRPEEAKANQPPREKSVAMKKIDEDLDKLLSKPAESREQLKDLAKNLTSMESDLKNKEKELAARNAALQQQLKKLDQMSRDANAKEGPAKDMQKALNQGDLDKAKKEAEDLARKLKDGKLDDKEKQDLAKQVDDLKDKLEELKRQRDEDLKKEKDNVDKQLDRGDIDKKTADQMKSDLDKQAQDGKDLDKLADQLKQAQQGLQEGDDQKAADGLKKAAEQMQKMDGDKKDLQGLRDKLDDLKKAQQALGPTLEGGKPNPGMGPRPMGKEEATNSMEHKVDSQLDDKGRKAISDFVAGPAFKKKSSQDIAGDVVQSSQDAEAAREQQRVDRSSRDIYKGYFENLRKDAEKSSTPPQPPRP